MLSCVLLFVTPWTVALKAPLSMGFPKARILEWVAISFSRGTVLVMLNFPKLDSLRAFEWPRVLLVIILLRVVAQIISEVQKKALRTQPGIWSELRYWLLTLIFTQVELNSVISERGVKTERTWQ